MCEISVAPGDLAAIRCTLQEKCTHSHNTKLGQWVAQENQKLIKQTRWGTAVYPVNILSCGVYFVTEQISKHQGTVCVVHESVCHSE